MGQIINKGVFWNLFWSLPYELRYSLYKTLNSKGFGIKQMHRIKQAGPTESSLNGFDRLKCIFVHIPKGGGVSINHQLFGNLGGSHRTIRDYSLTFNQHEFNSYYKFSVVRNPFERLASAYYFLKQGGLHNNDKLWFQENLSRYASIKTFVQNWLSTKNVYQYHHFMPQHEYVTINGKMVMDDVFKLESIDQTYRQVALKLGVPNVKLQRKNPTKGNQSYMRLFDADSKEIVAEVYRKDFELFNYKLS